MLWINAEPVVTSMTDAHPVGNISDEQLVGEPMRKPMLANRADDAVALVRSDCACPSDASILKTASLGNESRHETALILPAMRPPLLWDHVGHCSSRLIAEPEKKREGAWNWLPLNPPKKDDKEKK